MIESPINRFAPQFPIRAAAERLLDQADCDTTRAHLYMVARVQDLLTSDELVNVIQSLPPLRIPVAIHGPTVEKSIVGLRFMLTRPQYKSKSAELLSNLLRTSAARTAEALPLELRRALLTREAARAALNTQSLIADIASLSDNLELSDVAELASADLKTYPNLIFNHRYNEIIDLDSFAEALVQHFSENNYSREFVVSLTKAEIVRYLDWAKDDPRRFEHSGPVLRSPLMPTDRLTGLYQMAKQGITTIPIGEVMRHANFPVALAQREWLAYLAGANSLIWNCEPSQRLIAAGHPELDKGIRLAVLQTAESSGYSVWRTLAGMRHDDLVSQLADEVDTWPSFCWQVDIAQHDDAQLLLALDDAGRASQKHWNLMQGGSLVAQVAAALKHPDNMALVSPAAARALDKARSHLKSNHTFEKRVKISSWDQLPGSGYPIHSLPPIIDRCPSFVHEGVHVRVLRSGSELADIGMKDWEPYLIGTRTSMSAQKQYATGVLGSNVSDSPAAGYVVGHVVEGDRSALVVWSYENGRFGFCSGEFMGGSFERQNKDWVYEVASSVGVEWTNLHFLDQMPVGPVL